MADPISPSLPSRLARYQRKYAGEATGQGADLYNAAYQQASPAAINALARLDLTRIGRGQDPYTASQSAMGLTAATRGAPVTPEPEGGFWSDVTSNLSDLVRGIPQLPFALADEVGAVTQLADSLPAALKNSDGGGPLNTLGNLANLPGLRYIPGAFVAGAYGDEYTDPVTGQTITPGGTQQLIDNPLFTALDVLPYASKAAKLTPGYKAAAAAQLDQARVLGTPVTTPPRPIPTALRNLGGRVDQVPDLRQAFIDRGIVPERGFGNATSSSTAPPIAGQIASPGPIGRTLDRGTNWFNSTAPGQYLDAARGKLARTVSERALYNTSFITDPQRAAQLDPVAARVFHEGQAELRDLGRNISENQMNDLYRALTLDDQALRASFTPEQQAYVARFERMQNDIQDSLVQRGEDWYNSRTRGRGGLAGKGKPTGLLRVPFAHGDEIFDARTGAMILDARYAAEKRGWFRDARSRLDNPGQVTPQTLQSTLDTILSDAKLSTAERNQAVKLALYEADRAGVNTLQLWRDWGKVRDVPGRQQFLARVQDPAFTQSLSLHTPVDHARTISDTITTLSRIPSDGYARDLMTALKNNDVAGSRAALRRIASRKTFTPGIDIPMLRDAIGDMATKQRFDRALDTLGHTDKSLTKMQRDLTRIETRSMPARFDDVVRREARNKIVADIGDLQQRGQLSADKAAEAIDAASNDYFSRLESIDPGVAALIKPAFDEARGTWQVLAQNGLSPTWVHRVTPDSAAKIANPQVFDNASVTPGQLKQRLWDPSPTVTNLTVSIAHQAYDLLNEVASRQFADEMGNWYGITGQELQNRLIPVAEAAARRNPNKSVRAHLNEIIQRDYTAYDPATFSRGKGTVIRQTNSANQLYVPRAVATTLDRLRPILPTPFERVVAGPMKVFRTSLLPLSPRWHLYNIVGGAIMLGSIANPRTLTHMAEAWRLTRNGGEELGRIADSTGRAAMPPAGHLREASEWALKQKLRDPSGVGIAHSVAAGHTLGRVMAQIRDARATQLAAQGFDRVVQSSYDLNQFVDNMNRSMAYLTGEDRALRRGMSRDEAIEMGIHEARTALQSWDRLTPVERSGMRMIFPFYSWTRHLLSFVMQYPHDHPWRLAITARIAETEITDNQTGLPAQFASMFTPFGVDSATGETLGVFMDGANPFKDLTNWAMLAGFLTGQEGGNIATITGSLNPLVSTMLETAGFDTFRGTPDLYPDLVYDPATGQLTTSTGGGFLQNVLTNTIPQTEVLANLAGLNREFTDLARRNPEAAASQLRGAMGLPNLIRRVNIPEEQIKSEVQRYEEFRRTRTEALTSGNLSMMERYPVLDAYRQQMESAADSGQFTNYQAGTSPEYQAAAKAANLRQTDLLGALTGL